MNDYHANYLRTIASELIVKLYNAKEVEHLKLLRLHIDSAIEEITGKQSINSVVGKIKRFDTGEWLGLRQPGEEKRIQLMKLLDELYQVSGVDGTEAAR